MKRRLIAWPQAEFDVADAVAWYEDQRIGLGAELLDELDSVLRRVVATPFQFPQIGNQVRRALLSRFPYS
ncbi:MAG: type II toxin-antitoxin system RelE/ParE family toxin [Gammaproteobacteria bacterium]